MNWKWTQIWNMANWLYLALTFSIPDLVLTVWVISKLEIPIHTHNSNILWNVSCMPTSKNCNFIIDSPNPWKILNNYRTTEFFGILIPFDLLLIFQSQFMPQSHTWNGVYNKRNHIYRSQKQVCEDSSNKRASMMKNATFYKIYHHYTY